MRFGISVPATLDFYELAFLSKVAKEAEVLGFDSLLLPDHVFLPWSSELPETWQVLTCLALQTSSLRLGACVSPLSLRDPRYLARAIATAEWVAPGRIIAGLGVGWFRGEYEEYGRWTHYQGRLEKAEAALNLIISLLTKQETSADSPYYGFKRVKIHLNISRPEFWFGTKETGKSLVLASRCDGWIVPSWHVSPERFGQAELPTKKRFTRGVLGGVVSKSKISQRPPFPERYFMGNLDSCRRAVEEYADNGCNYYVCSSFFPKRNYLPLLKDFADEIIPSWR